MLGQGEGETVALADLAVAPPIMLCSQRSCVQRRRRFERGDLEPTGEEPVYALTHDPLLVGVNAHANVQHLGEVGRADDSVPQQRLDLSAARGRS